MNCKQGDLAIVIRGWYSGRLVECVKWIGSHSGRDVDGISVASDETWEIRYSGRKMFATDSQLRPIRGTPETVDERKEVEA